MQNKIILGLVAVLALVVLGLFFFNKNSGDMILKNAEMRDTNPSAQEMEQVYTVLYSLNGFSPATLEIPRGATVMFKNESGSPLWVASAMHPTHSVYPQKSPDDCLGSSFDACAGVPHGASWPFTFNEIGSWNYHDHLHANKWGTIIVK